MKSVYETKPICDSMKTNHSDDDLLQGQQLEELQHQTIKVVKIEVVSQVQQQQQQQVKSRENKINLKMVDIYQMEEVHNQSMQNQDQIQDIPETMQMWQEAINEEQMKSILESKVCESIENEYVASDDEIEYENMSDLIDPISEEILDDEILKSKFSNRCLWEGRSQFSSWSWRDRRMTVSAKRCTRQQFLGWQECDGGLKEMEAATLTPSHSHSFKSESRLR